jgi:hypothetical protein
MEVAYVELSNYTTLQMPSSAFIYRMSYAVALRAMSLETHISLPTFSPSGYGQLKYDYRHAWSSNGVVHVMYRYCRPGSVAHVLICRQSIPLKLTYRLKLWHSADVVEIMLKKHKGDESTIGSLFLSSKESTTGSDLKTMTTAWAIERNLISPVGSVDIFAYCACASPCVNDVHNASPCGCNPIHGRSIVYNSRKRTR